MTKLTIKAKILTRCILHTIFEFMSGFDAKEPSHFFW